MDWRRSGIVWLLCLAMRAAAGDIHISAHALFDGRAMLSINGNTQLLRAGQSSPEGVKLVAATAKSAIVEFEGQRQTLTLDRHISGNFAPVERRSVAIHRDDRNQYLLVGSINGRQLQFLVDTGASVVALSGDLATQLGIDYRLHGTPSRVTTASGVVNAWSINLDRVETAGIVVRNVRASVLEGGYPDTPLLGMTYLSQTTMREDTGVLYIEER